MTPLKRWLIWLSRIHKCQGFGIQSPTDFDFVRLVVNEHGPYYAYDEIKAADWLQRKFGKLYLRVANWRQPDTIVTNDYQPWLQAGCRSARIISDINEEPLQLWHAIEHDTRTGTTFDLYYCGIVLFDTQRYKHNYRINF